MQFFRSKIFLLGLALGLAGTATALANTESLIKNSPFVPEGYNPSAPGMGINPGKITSTKKRGGKIEFRGAAKIDGQWFFSIYDTKKRRGYWVLMNDPSAEFLVTSYNADAKAITVQDASGPQVLTLKEPSQRRFPLSSLNRPPRTPASTRSPSTGTRPNTQPSSRTPTKKSSSPRNSSSNNNSKGMPSDIPPELIPLFESLK